jgi:serine-type D-Ala-D-Ala carboxypeptidase/endopeptidase
VKVKKFLFGLRLWIVVAGIALAMCFLLATQTVLAQTQTFFSHPTNRLDSIVDQAATGFMSDACHVGLSIAVVSGSETRFYNYGSRSRDSKIPATADCIYEIGSVTKTFTGTLAGKAVVEHRMDLDSDFSTYLPERYPNLSTEGDPITLRDLATHRSGLPRDLPDLDDLLSHHDFERLPYQILHRDERYDRTRYLRELHAVRLRSPPGTKEAYSNLGMKVIGLGLEQVYATSFETLMQRAIFKPLGMDSTGFVVKAAERHRLVRGYSRGGNPMPYHLRNAGAAYGLYSTPRDLAKYVQWHLDESDPVIHLAHSLLHGDTADGQALIWNVASQGSTRILWHGGGTFGATSQIVLFPDEREGYVLLANDTCKGTEEALRNAAIKVHDVLRAPSH